MSNHQAKFIKVIMLKSGDNLVRNDGTGKWEHHYKTGNPKARTLNDTQSEMIDAAIEATFAHTRKVFQ